MIIFVLGHWPIPESFWPEVTMSVLPPRSAHPNIKFACTNAEPLVIENLPFDKYELEPSPLTQYILSRKQPKTCWQVNFHLIINTGNSQFLVAGSIHKNVANIFLIGSFFYKFII